MKYFRTFKYMWQWELNDNIAIFLSPTCWVFGIWYDRELYHDFYGQHLIFLGFIFFGVELSWGEK